MRGKKVAAAVVLVLALLSLSGTTPVYAQLSCSQGYEEIKAICMRDYNTCLAQSFGIGPFYAMGCAATYAGCMAGANAFLLACVAIP